MVGPDHPDTYGGFLRVGSLFGPTVREVSGGTPITVENSLPAAFGSLGSS